MTNTINHLTLARMTGQGFKKDKKVNIDLKGQMESKSIRGRKDVQSNIICTKTKVYFLGTKHGFLRDMRKRKMMNKTGIVDKY